MENLVGDPRKLVLDNIPNGYYNISIGNRIIKEDEMKELIAKCDLCGTTRIFTGETIEEIIQALDNEGWYDFPDGKKIKFNCKNCLNKMENELVKE
jgi:hypothetical protein